MSLRYQFIAVIVAVVAYSALPRTACSQVTQLNDQRDAQLDAITLAVIHQLRDRDPEAALATLGDAVSNDLSIRAVIKTPLPAAAGGVFRSLSQESVDDQFEWLSTWTMPNDARENVRLLATPVPIEAPPKTFARLLGERPRDDSFNVASVGPVEGFLSTGWMFVQAADEIGRLTRLRAELEALSEVDVAGAVELHILSQLAGSRGDLEAVNAFLSAHADRQPDDPVEHDDLVVASIACAALGEPSLQNAAERVLKSLVDHATTGDVILLRPFFRIAHATAVQLQYGTSSPQIAFQNRLKHWVPVSLRTAWSINRGRISGQWLVHENHVLHLAGGQTNLLICSIPLRGDFDFVCETQEGGNIGTDGGLAYGGLQFQALGRNEMLTVLNADADQSGHRYSAFARGDSSPAFNRVSIRSRDGIASFESNFHTIWTDSQEAHQSPWLALRSDGTKRPIFRALKLVGTPEIPREVRLVAGDALRGWQTGFFNQQQPSFDPSLPRIESVDWNLAAGTLTSTASTDPIKQRSLIQYQRPLLDDESISYEFFFNGDDSILHPTLGRLAFLLEPSGVRVHWVTTGDRDWTALPADNALLEPLSRRGPRNLPLKENDWNAVTVRQSARDVSMELNGEPIYLRKREDGRPAQFALYRPARKGPAQVRNIVLRGGWPTTMPLNLLETADADAVDANTVDE